MPERGDAHPDVHKLIVDRWSPRSFDGESVGQDDLAIIFEAAGWAPSAFNAQPWTFLYARPGDSFWDDFLSCLIDFNRQWAQDAGALIYIVSKEAMGEGADAKPSHSHSFDAGSAWAMMALQATHMGYHAHGMTGVDFDRARTVLAVPHGYRIEAAVAIGKRGDPAKLPDKLREREVPSSRKPVTDIAVNGTFPTD